MKILSLAWLLLIAASSANAATYWVDGTNSLGAITCTNTTTPQTTLAESTITRGIACMSAGDTLYIRSGSYNERIRSQSGALIPDGTLGSPTTITAYAGETVTISPTSQGSTNLLGFDNGTTPTYISIVNIIFDCTNAVGTTSNATSCIFFGSDSSNIVLNGITVKNNGKATWDTPGFNTAILTGAGILMGGTGHTVKNSFIHDNGRKPNVNPAGFSGGEAPYGIYQAASSVTIENNHIYRNGGYGIHGFLQSGTPTGNIYRYNKIWDNHDTAVSQGTASILQYGNNHTIHHNTIYRTSARAGAVGITVRNGSGNKIVNNTVVGFNGTDGIGIQVDGNTSPLIKNNISVGNSTNVDTSVGNTGVTSTTNTTVTPGSLQSIFADAVNADFRLCRQAGNPDTDCTGIASQVDGGSDISSNLSCVSGSTCRDRVGTITPVGSAFDIGAEEAGNTDPIEPSPLIVLQVSCDNVVTDSSGQSNNGTLTNGATYNAIGKYSGACSFDGVNDSVTVADASSLDLTHGFTLAAWVLPTSIASDAVVITKNSSRYFLFASLDGVCGNNAIAGGFSSGTNTFFACYSTPLTTSVWTHLAITYNRTSLILYVNGSPVTTTSATAFIPTNSETVQIGGSVFNEYFTGLIDEPYIRNVALSAAGVVTLMNTPINALSPNTVVIKISGGSTWKYADSSVVKYGTPP